MVPTPTRSGDGKVTVSAAVAAFRKAHLSRRKEIPLSDEIVEQITTLVHDETFKRYLDVCPCAFVVPKGRVKKEIGLDETGLPVIVRETGEGSYVACRAPAFMNRPARTVCAGCFIPWDPYKGFQFEFTSFRLEDHRVPPTCGSCHDKDHGLFSLGCEHFACADCWFSHAASCIISGRAPVPCFNSTCRKSFSITQAAIILDDESLDIYSDALWETLTHSHSCLPPPRPDRSNFYVRCANCTTLLEQDLGSRLGHEASCGHCWLQTCLHCESRSHFPLSCEAHANWLGALQSNFLLSARETAVAPRRVQLPQPQRLSGPCEKCLKEEHVQIHDRIFCVGCGDGLSTRKMKLTTVEDFATCLRPRIELIEKFGNGPDKLGLKFNENDQSSIALVELAHAAEIFRVRRLCSHDYNGNWKQLSKKEIAVIDDLGARIEAEFVDNISRPVPLHWTTTTKLSALLKEWKDAADGTAVRTVKR